MNTQWKKRKCVYCDKIFIPKRVRNISCSKYCNRKRYERDNKTELKKSRAEHYLKNIEKERANCKKWYQKNRESEIEKNRDYRNQNRELFDWYHNKERFDGKKNEIIKRDNEKCKLCDLTSKSKLVVHHIDGKNHYNDNPNNDEKNLITLCKYCHTALHQWQRRNRKLVSSEDIVQSLGKPKEHLQNGVVRKSFIYGK